MTFLSPWILIAGIFALVPVIIHLWFKRRLPRIPFSSLAFLKTAEAKRFGWLRLREILILVSRCCFIACLVISLARPRVQRPVFGSSHTASVMLLIDNSYSMSYGGNFSRARAIAQELIARSSSQSEIMVVPLCRALADSALRPFWTSKRSANALLESIDLTHKKGIVFDALTSCPWQDARHPVERIYIGDGQTVSFTDYPDTMPPLWWLQTPVGNNCGLTRVSLLDPIALPAETYDIAVTVQNYGSRRWDGKVVVAGSTFTHDIPATVVPYGEQVLTAILPRTVRHGVVTLEPDSIGPDNACYFSYRTPRVIRILIKGANRFITSALYTADMLTTPFFITNVAALGNADARSYDIIIICGNARLTAAERALLEIVTLQHTTSVICVLGSVVDPQLTEFLAPYCTIGRHIDPAGYVTLERIDYAHPVFTVFRDDPTLKTSKVYDYWSLSGTGHVHARVTDGNPFIISKDNVTVFATDLMPHSTDLVYKTAFIPLLFRLIMISAQPDMDLERTVGTANSIAAPLKAPTGEFVAEGSEFQLPGLYLSGDTVVAVNVDPEEGNCAVIGSEAARLLRIIPVDPGDLTGTDLNLFFLICALAFLLFEVVFLLIR